MLVLESKSQSVEFYDHYLEDNNIDLEPFQVLDSKGVWIGESSILLSRKTLIKRNEHLKIDEGGYLLIIHHSGFMFEFNGDTVINIQQLSEEISRKLKLNRRKVNSRINIARLHINFPVQFISRPLSYFSCGPSTRIEIIAKRNSTEISITNPVICLNWTDQELPNGNRKYRIIIKNIFDETVGELFTDQTHVTIDFSTFQDKSGMYLIRVEDIKDPKEPSPEIGVRVDSQSQYFPRTCDPTTPVQALEMAYYYEDLSYIDDAAFYYNLADELSDQPIYTTFLNNFKARNGIE
jgi:hypothetical protein